MSLRVRAISCFLYYVTKALIATLRVTLVGEAQIEQMRERYGGVILATWHGRTLIPIVLFGGRGWWSMVSTSRDGEYQARILDRYGFKHLRGSTSARGAVTSCLRLAKTVNQGGVVAITPDGPRGPMHTVHPGAVFIAEKSGCPILPVGVGAFPRKCLSTWDGFIVPGIGARAAVVFGEPMMVPSHLDDAQRSELTHDLAERLQRAEEQAEELVRVGGVKRSAPVY